MVLLKQIPIKGTILDAVIVFLGTLIGLQAKSFLSIDIREFLLAGLGLTVFAYGIKMFLSSTNFLVVIISITLGGFIGKFLGLTQAFHTFADFFRNIIGTSGNFSEAFLTTSLLFCIGPMTFLGCIQEGIENRFDILSIKSILDGISAVFFAAALGPGVLITPLFILIFQSALTLLARPFRTIFQDKMLIAELTATGGIILMAISLGTINLKQLPSECFLPALVLAPILSKLFLLANIGLPRREVKS